MVYTARKGDLGGDHRKGIKKCQHLCALPSSCSKWHYSLKILRGSKEVIKSCICTTLEHITSELYNGLPAAGRDMNSTNDLDIVPRDAVGHDAPARIGSRAIRQAMLKVVKLNQ